MNIEIDENIKNMFQSLLLFNRMPQSVIIENGDENTRKQAASFLSVWAVCNSERERPCMTCSNCHKAINDIHSDIFIPEPEGKTKTISMKNLRDNILPNLSIIPNEADTKVFIFYDADKTLREDTQNTLLKSIEEPVQNILFIFTCESANSLLQTIRSRSQIFTLPSSDTVSEETDKLAREIIDGITKTNESNLLISTYKLKSKEEIKEVIPVVSMYLSKALKMSSGIQYDDELIKTSSKKLSKTKLIALIESCDDILIKANTNVNLNLLNTYICSSFRRKAWQK